MAGGGLGIGGMFVFDPLQTFVIAGYPLTMKMVSRFATPLVMLITALEVPANAQGAPMGELTSQNFSTESCKNHAPTAEIIVCAEKSPKRSRYRIPSELVEKQETTFSRRDVAGVTMSLGQEVSAVAPCGLFVGQRSCSEAEAKLYGYEKGRDPVTFVYKILKDATEAR